MKLTIILALIAKLVLVCDGCDVGTSGVNNFVYTKVGVSTDTIPDTRKL
jgi:hypothetical protein